jgi:hypothetical protein
MGYDMGSFGQGEEEQITGDQIAQSHAVINPVDVLNDFVHIPPSGYSAV